jgi:CBS domain-containing protein
VPADVTSHPTPPAFIGLYGNLWLVVIAAFVFLAATAEARVVELEAALEPHTVAEAMSRHVVVAGPSDAAVDVARLAVAEGSDVVVVAGRGRVGVAGVAQLAAVALWGQPSTLRPLDRQGGDRPGLTPPLGPPHATTYRS